MLVGQGLVFCGLMVNSNQCLKINRSLLLRLRGLRR